MLLMDKVCVVVGVGSLRGIGYGAAELFAEHGAKVVAVDVMMTDEFSTSVQAAISEKLGRPADFLGVQCDIRDFAACQGVFDAAVARFGRVDVLVNSAAIVESKGVLDIETPAFERMMDVNLTGAFNLCKAALKVFTGQGSGSIVNVSSVAAQRGGGLVGGAHYAASKGGVVSLTKSIAREFGPQGIRANIVCPSMTETGMLDDTVSPERYAEIVAQIPLRRAGRTVDVASACLFLASEMAAYITGATIDVNGGSHIH
jgi:NAD(P)-dependent dehydrogenase (short-subunit alcohol dehydrogenase family)